MTIIFINKQKSFILILSSFMRNNNNNTISVYMCHGLTTDTDKAQQHQKNMPLSPKHNAPGDPISIGPAISIKIDLSSVFQTFCLIPPASFGVPLSHDASLHPSDGL